MRWNREICPQIRLHGPASKRNGADKGKHSQDDEILCDFDGLTDAEKVFFLAA